MSTTARVRSGAAGDPAAGIAIWWPVLGSCPLADRWLALQSDLRRSPRTIEAYARSLVDYLGCCDRHHVDLVEAGRAEIARYVRDLRERPGRQGANVIAISSGAGLANATLQLRVTVVRLFYDFLVEERVRDRNPVGRGYRGGDGSGGRCGLVPRVSSLPWIPSDAQWCAVLAVAAGEPLRNRLMLALAYDAGLRREELCLLQRDDLDPAHRTLRVRAQTTKTRRGRVVTLRHLCLTDLARSGWELHQIATFAGHQKTDMTQRYIHLSGRDLADRLQRGMSQIHAQRIAQIGAALS